MKTSGLLDQLLKAGHQVLQQQTSSAGRRTPPGRTGQASSGDGGLSGLLGGTGGNALAASAMGMLLGGRKRGRLGGKAAKYGGLAVLGTLAYKAYSQWQAQQASAPRGEARTADRLPAEELETHSQAVLKALVAAAKADGHVDENERALIDAEMAKLTDDPEVRTWLNRELNRPLDPADVASAAKTPEMAMEMYLASVLMVDEAQFMERAYLDELARQLKLDPALQRQLEAQAQGG